MKNKQMYLNLFAQLFSFVVSFIISFFVSPTIVRTVGKETYGFLGVANNFTSYVTIITVALNSLAGRFVSVNYHQNKHDEAAQYFTSVFVSNVFVVLFLLVPAIVFSAKVDSFLNVPSESVVSVKMTFALVFLGFFVNLAFSIFSAATFVTNKIYLASIRSIEANLLRLTIIGVSFVFFKPSIVYVALAMFGYNIFVALTNYRYTKILLPTLKIKWSQFRKNKVKELIVSGCWSSITALSNVLLEGLDLLISNLLIDVSAMGTVSIVKTVPSMINQCLYSVLSVFTPQLTICYAKGDKKGMISYMEYSCKVVAMFMALPVAFLVSLGYYFFSLWMPTENAFQLWTLSLLSIGGLVFAGAVVIMHNLFTVTNHLKIPAIATLVTGVLNTIVVLLLLKFTKLGIYAVVSVSSLLALGRNLFVNIPYSAKCAGVSSVLFYKIAGRSFLFVVISAVIGSVLALVITPSTWVMLIVCAFVMCMSSMIIEFMLFFTKDEKQSLVVEIKNLLIKRNP